jgi:hypothetical protein
MFSNDLKNEMKKKFNLTDSILNSSRHYKIPNFIFKSKSEKLHNKSYTPVFKNKVISLRGFINDKSNELKNISKTQYYEKKRAKINKILTDIQKEKIDLLINSAYHKINDNIREYNKNLCLPRRENKVQLDYLPLIQKEKIIDHAMNQVQKYLPFINKKYEFIKYGNKKSNTNLKDEEMKNRQLYWSRNFLQQKKLEEYKKIYKIKYIHSEEINNNNKFKDEFIQKDSEGIENDRYVYSLANNKTSTRNSLKKNSIMNYSKISFTENLNINAKKKFK